MFLNPFEFPEILSLFCFDWFWLPLISRIFFVLEISTRFIYTNFLIMKWNIVLFKYDFFLQLVSNRIGYVVTVPATILNASAMEFKTVQMDQTRPTARRNVVWTSFSVQTILVFYSARFVMEKMTVLMAKTKLVVRPLPRQLPPRRRLLQRLQFSSVKKLNTFARVSTRASANVIQLWSVRMSQQKCIVQTVLNSNVSILDCAFQMLQFVMVSWIVRKMRTKKIVVDPVNFNVVTVFASIRTRSVMESTIVSMPQTNGIAVSKRSFKTLLRSTTELFPFRHLSRLRISMWIRTMYSRKFAM